MSEESEFEVKALHEELLEEENERDHLAQRVAVMTAILATLGAVFSFQSGHTQTEASMLKSDSITSLTQANDRWAQYQSKSTREYMAKVMALVAIDQGTKEMLNGDALRYSAEKEEIKKDAEMFQADAEKFGKQAEDILRPHHKLSLAMTLVQIAIALSSLTVLTRKKWLFVGAGISAIGGIGLAIAAWLM